MDYLMTLVLALAIGWMTGIFWKIYPFQAMHHAQTRVMSTAFYLITSLVLAGAASGVLMGCLADINRLIAALVVMVSAAIGSSAGMGYLARLRECAGRAEEAEEREIVLVEEIKKE